MSPMHQRLQQPSEYHNRQTSEYRIIYTDLLDRLKSANNGLGMKFQDLKKSVYLEYLLHMGILEKDINSVGKIISDMFSDNSGKAQTVTQQTQQTQTHMLSDKDLEELKGDSDFLPMMQSHPYTKTKQEPRKTVFGAITKL